MAKKKTARVMAFPGGWTRRGNKGYDWSVSTGDAYVSGGCSQSYETEKSAVAAAKRFVRRHLRGHEIVVTEVK
jgi:hypothetical protein